MLKPGGRGVVLVWSRVEEFPVFQLLNERAAQRFGFAPFAAPFSFPSAEALRGVFVDAGFVGVRVESIRKEHTFPNPATFMRLQFAASASVLPELREKSGEELAALAALLEADVRADLDRFLVDGQFVFEGVGNVAVAVR